MDIVGYAGFSTQRQHAFKQALRQLLQPPDKPLQDHEAQLRDTPSGVQMVFLSRPEHAALMALRLLHALQAAEPTPAAPLQPAHLRMGLHFGTVHEVPDMEMRIGYLGEAARTSAHLMEAAAPGQALASPAFFEQLEYATHGAESLFQAAVALPAGGTGQGCAYPLSTHPAALAEMQRRVQDLSAATAALASELNKNIQTVQGWLTPVNVLVTFGTFLITVIGRFTDQARAMNTIAAVLLVFALGLALLWRLQRIPAWKKRLDKRYGGHLRAWATGATTALVLAASGAMALAAWVTTQDAAPALAAHTAQPTGTRPEPAPPSAATTPALPANPAAAPGSANRERAATASSAPPSPSAPEAAPVSAAPTASAPPPPPAPASAAAMANTPAQATRPSTTAEARKRPGPAPLAEAAPERPQASAQATAPSPALLARRAAAAAERAPPAAPARPERCALILQKASLDEPLSAQDKNFLLTTCK